MKCTNCNTETSVSHGLGGCDSCHEAVKKVKESFSVPSCPTEGWIRLTPEGQEIEDYSGCESNGLIFLSHPSGWEKTQCVRCGADYPATYIPLKNAQNEVLAKEAEKARERRAERWAAHELEMKKTEWRDEYYLLREKSSLRRGRGKIVDPTEENKRKFIEEGNL